MVPGGDRVEAGIPRRPRQHDRFTEALDRIVRTRVLRHHEHAEFHVWLREGAIARGCYSGVEATDLSQKTVSRCGPGFTYPRHEGLESGSRPELILGPREART